VDPSLTATGEARREAERPRLARGDVVGRLIVTGEIGAGGMGVVYEAYDPALDRKVAVKLLRGAAGSDARLLREAQAMARVVHPNVVTVHEAGRFHDQVYIAMERVAGGTLREWLAAPRTWRETVAAFLQAGRGLAAAHDAGLVHRDFKPENVLVGDDGRVRVTDFGLVGAVEPSDPRDELATPPEAALEARLTEAGARLGTPSYMAPELLRGEPASTASDQFAFCVALHEGLHGERPPGGRRRVPAWLQRAVQRGLRAEPEARWPSMHALLAELARDPGARGRRVAMGAALIVAAGAAALAARRTGETCAGGEEQLAGAWDAAARERTRAAFAASGAPLAVETWERFAAALDGHAARWAAAHRRSCEATRVRGVASDAVLDLRMACLGRRRDELAALAALYERPDAAMVGQAPLAAHRLGAPESCADLDVLAARLEPPAGDARVAALRRVLTRADALFRAGRYRDARAVAIAASAAAGAVGFAPLEAEARFLEGVVAGFDGDPAAAEAALTAALRLAKAAGHGAVESDAWTELVWVTGKDLARYDEALRLAEIARGALAASPDEGRAALLDNNVAEVLIAKGQSEPALALHRRALARREKTFGPAHPDVAKSLHNLGNLYYQTGRMAESVDAFRRATESFAAALGPRHVLTGRARGSLGEALRAAGRLDEAAAELQGAREVLVAALGAEALPVAFVDTNLGLLLARLGRADDARASFGRALAIFEARRGPDHPDVAHVLQGLGDLERDPARALPLLERALAIRRAAAVDPVRIAESQVAIARAVAASDPARARALLAEARPVLVAAGEAGKDVLAVADAVSPGRRSTP
jgi:tetratricopeptide (TPR) repeat protein